MSTDKEVDKIFGWLYKKTVNEHSAVSILRARREAKKKLLAWRDKSVNEALDSAKKFIEEEVTGCSIYVMEDNSLKCVWCGATKGHSNHDKARILANLNKRVGK